LPDRQCWLEALIGCLNRSTRAGVVRSMTASNRCEVRHSQGRIAMEKMTTAHCYVPGAN
jgi:hypothetical protein